ncbi:MAG TPA: zinc ribbon domain-containing protein [Anaerolineae bacterium]|jgi:putative FmdB family regulatory protein|nr:zinc ribbon domain-containing protein [Anaerolineae bacterium]
MPTYQFACNDCGKDYEFFLTRMLRDSDEVCPSCGSTNVRRAYRDFFGYTANRSGSGFSGGGYSGGYSGGSSCTSGG